MCAPTADGRRDRPTFVLRSPHCRRAGLLSLRPDCTHMFLRKLPRLLMDTPGRAYYRPSPTPAKRQQRGNNGGNAR
jgi:hypothetical protein